MLVKIIGANLGSVKMFSTLGSVKIFSTLGSVKMFSDISCKENIDDMFLSLIQKDVLTGLLLSDGMLTKRNKVLKVKLAFL